MNGRTYPRVLDAAGRGPGRRGRTLGPRAIPERQPVTLWIALAIGVAAVWLWLAVDGRLHWDEPEYLYAAAYLTVPEILAGDFQPSGLDGFTVSRVGHLLLLRLLISLLGPGMASLAVISGLYLLMLAAFLWVTYLILRALAPAAPYPGAAVALCAFTPICVYLAFKTLAEIPAVLLAALAVLGLLQSFRSRPVPWLLLVALALAGVAVTKNNVALLYASFVAALVLSGGPGHRPGRIVAHATASGVGSVAIFFAVLWATGIPLDRYLAVANNVALFKGEPFETKLLALALEGGPFFLALPLAFLGPRRAEARLFATWFALATLPVLLSHRVEERYLVTNFVALAGLVQLSIEGLTPFIRRWWAVRPSAVAAAAGFGGGALVAAAAAAQPLTAHEVQLGQLRTTLRSLDEIHGRGDYPILTPEEDGVFLFLRFVSPERPVYTVFTPRPPDHRDAEAWIAFQSRYYGLRALRTPGELAALDTADLVYLGFEESFPVANLRRLVGAALPPPLQRLVDERLSRMNLLDHLAGSWMWGHPRIRFSELLRHGHYVALRVELVPAR